MRRMMSMLGVMAIVAGCASSGASDAPPVAASEGTPHASEPVVSDGGAPSAAPGGGSTGNGASEGTAVVVVGDERFEFGGLHCITMGGALGAVSIADDPSVDISLPPADWETSAEEWDAPSVRVSGDEPYFDWHAGGETVELMGSVAPGSSQVDAYETDGFRATGSATFVDLATPADVPASLTGTFELECPRP